MKNSFPSDSLIQFSITTDNTSQNISSLVDWAEDVQTAPNLEPTTNRGASSNSIIFSGSLGRMTRLVAQMTLSVGQMFTQSYNSSSSVEMAAQMVETAEQMVESAREIQRTCNSTGNLSNARYNKNKTKTKKETLLIKCLKHRANTLN